MNKISVDQDRLLINSHLDWSVECSSLANGYTQHTERFSWEQLTGFRQIFPFVTLRLHAPHVRHLF